MIKRWFEVNGTSHSITNNLEDEKEQEKGKNTFLSFRSQ